LVIDAIAYCVSVAVARPSSTSASPIARDHTSSPPRKTPVQRLGSRAARWASPTMRAKRSSGVGKGSERARDQLNRTRDVVRGDDSAVSHRAAKVVLEPARLLHRLDRAGGQRAEWAAEPLRQAQRDRVEAAPDLRRGDAGRDRRVHHARTVEMQAQPELACG